MRSSWFGPLLYLTVLVNPVLAEVCDKMAYETWMPEHGPVGFTLTPGMLRVLAIVAVIAILVSFFRLARTAIILGILPIGFGALAAYYTFSEDAVLFAIWEGCFSLTVLILEALTLPLAGVGIVFLGIWMRHRRIKAV